MMKTISMIITFVFLAGCSDYTEIKETPLRPSPGGFSPVSPGEDDQVKSLIDFEQIKKSIIDNNCLQCHPGYSNYNTVVASAQNILDQVVTNRMPKNASPLNDELKLILEEWVNNGAPEFVEIDNGEDDTSVPGPLEPVKLEATWESVSQMIIFPKCVSCHNSNGQASFLPLATRQDFFDGRDYLLNNFEDARNSYLIEVITDPEEPMPPVWSPFEQLNQEEIEIMIEWIEKGLP